jgi:hypothetical protein
MYFRNGGGHLQYENRVIYLSHFSIAFFVLAVSTLHTVVSGNFYTQPERVFEKDINKNGAQLSQVTTQTREK